MSARGEEAEVANMVKVDGYLLVRNDHFSNVNNKLVYISLGMPKS